MDEQVVTGAGPETEGGIAAFAARYPFPLDAFQLEAIQHLAEGRSVLVAAPTGTGKTLVAEYAIWCAQQRNQRVIYTTPLKALSNQKYRDLRAMYGFDAVGLVTGDIVEHSRASIVVMTTEVYRNMLLEEGADRFTEDENFVPSSLADAGYIIFDELHYLSDVERGPVWEEAIICSPPHVQLVGLSATVSNAEDLADWISRVHGPISLVFHEERAVPLEHYYFLDGELRLVQDAEGNRVERFPGTGGEARAAMMGGRGRVYTFGDDEEEEEDTGKEDGRQIWQRKRREGRLRTAAREENAGAAVEAGEERKPKRPVEHKTPEPGEILTALRNADLLPCLYFLPGRKVVEDAAMSASLHLFTTSEEEALIREEVGAWLAHLPKEDRNLHQVHMLAQLLPRGIAYHHAGLLPGLKVLVETLFARGRLRAVFATDTLALGINMPARSVVVGSLSKFDGQEMRLLTPNEYRQLTGRAGRRGMDVRGVAVIPYSPWEPFEESFARITGELLPVTSSFIVRYNSVLNLWRPGDIKHLRRICASSLREYQRYIGWERRELARLERLERRAQAQEGKKSGKKKMAAAKAAAQELEKRRKRIGAYPLSRAGAAELDGTIFALHALDYIDERDRLTLKGRLLRGIFHHSGILIVELIMRGILDELTAAELAEVCSWFTFDSDRRLNNHNVLNSRLVQVRRELWYIVQHVHTIEEEARITPTPGIVPEFHGVALAWARGMSLSGLLRRIDLAEGDLLMLLNQTIDLLQQVQSAVGQVVDARDIWPQAPGAPAPIEAGTDSSTTAKRSRRRAEQLQLYRAGTYPPRQRHYVATAAQSGATEGEHLERLRPLLAQASSLLIRGIIIQSRTVPSMVARIGGEELPLDSEEDTDPGDVIQGV